MVSRDGLEPRAKMKKTKQNDIDLKSDYMVFMVGLNTKPPGPHETPGTGVLSHIF